MIRLKGRHVVVARAATCVVAVVSFGVATPARAQEPVAVTATPPSTDPTPPAVHSPSTPPAPAPPAAPAPAAPPPAAPPAKAPSWLSSESPELSFSAYLQAQYESHDDSENELRQGGAYLNQDRFLVRRARLRADAAWRLAELTLEVDGNTTRGARFGLRRAEATIVHRGSGPWDGGLASQGPRKDSAPVAALTVGLTEIPFGFEQVDSAKDRLFTERSQGSLALFPGEPDLGVRLHGGLSFFRYSVALLNGEPLDDRSSDAGRDPTAAKDLVARLGAVARPSQSLRVSGGVSILRGDGFHPGTSATKSGAQWRDLNENSAIDAGEVSGAPGGAPIPSETFPRWAIGSDLGIGLQTALGTTSLYGEVTLAENLDRGLFPADPVATGLDARELAFYAAVTQDVTEYGVLGLRFDHYDPNADFLEKQKGKLLPASQAIDTVSPVVGLVLPGVARLVFQYDLVSDSLAKDYRGVPTDLANDRWTLRLQVAR